MFYVAQAIAFVPVRSDIRLAAAVKRACASTETTVAVGLVGFGRDATQAVPGPWATILDDFLHVTDLAHAAEHHLPFMLRTRRPHPGAEMPSPQSCRILVVSESSALVRNSLSWSGFDVRDFVFVSPSVLRIAMDSDPLAIVTDSVEVAREVGEFCESNGRALILIAKGPLVDYGVAHGIWTMSEGVLYPRRYTIPIASVFARRPPGLCAAERALAPAPAGEDFDLFGDWFAAEEEREGDAWVSEEGHTDDSMAEWMSENIEIGEIPVTGDQPLALVTPLRTAGRRQAQPEDDEIRGPGLAGTGRRKGTLEKAYKILDDIAHFLVPGMTWMSLLDDVEEGCNLAVWERFVHLANWKTRDAAEVAPPEITTVPFRHLSHDGIMYVSEAYYYYNNVNRDPIEFNIRVLRSEIVKIRRYKVARCEMLPPIIDNYVNTPCAHQLYAHSSAGRRLWERGRTARVAHRKINHIS